MANRGGHDLRPYPEYKDSGLPWLGTIPAHWEEKRAKYFFREVDERSQTGDEELLSVSHVTGVTPRSQKNVTMFKAESYVGSKLCHAGDLVINTMWAWMAALGVARQTGIVSPAYGVYRPRQSHAFMPDFVDHLLRTHPYASEYFCRSTGIRKSRLRLYPEKFLEIPIVCPPIVEEQQQIVAYLRAKDQVIRRFIRNKRRVIELLNEQKQAFIHRAVTRGLDPGVRLKASGVDWLGEVPEHWERLPLKGVCTIQSGVTLGKFYVGEQMTEYSYLRVANVQAGRLALSSVKTLRLPLREAKRSTLQVGDVLMTEGGDPDKLGRGCLWNGEIKCCLHQNHIFAVRPDCDRLRPQFLAALLGSHYAKLYFLRTAKQTTNLASTNKTTIGQFRVLLPSVDEQDAILRSLEAEQNSVTSAIDRTEREITLIREYRARLITDVVTGKIDVRHVCLASVEPSPANLEPLDNGEAIGDELPDDEDLEAVEEAADADG